MLTQRDVDVGVRAVKDACAQMQCSVTDDQAHHLVVAVVNAVDAARSPLNVGHDVLANLLKPVA
jgi:flavin reductase (DIM6/NTAB) family NADH-FMN oxidoreductase RutF